MKRILTYITVFLTLPLTLCAQGINDNIERGNNEEGFGGGAVYSPFRKNQRDTTKTELNVPQEIRQWHISELLGEVIPVNADTLQHLYQNWHNTDGMNGEYNYLGNMGSPRLTRIFFNRQAIPEFSFLKPYDYFMTPVSQFCRQEIRCGIPFRLSVRTRQI